MRTKTVYILHKNGADSHYLALKHLLASQGITLKYREFSILSKLFKGITKGKMGQVKKQFVNIGFFISLLFSTQKKVVLGIAPYDKKLGRLLFFLKKHSVYYHTSWTVWDKTFQPKRIKKPEVLKDWTFFLEQKVEQIFAVSATTQHNIAANYKIPLSKISVVYHSVDDAFLATYPVEKTKNSFVYYGRLVAQKGIVALLAYFQSNPDASMTFIGEGPFENEIKTAAATHKNIHYKPYFSNKNALANTIASFEYLIVNSLKTDKWEELFGMVIIEGWAQGLQPLATNHSGPRELITPQLGYLCDEGDMGILLDEVLSATKKTTISTAKLKAEAQKYTVESIAKRWKKTLE